MGDPDLTGQLRLARVRGGAFWDHVRSDALELIATAVHHWLPAGQSRTRSERTLHRAKRPPKERMAPLLEAFGELRPQACFVQIGASEDPRREPIREQIRNRHWPGIVVEPIPQALARMRRLYGERANLAYEQAAIGPSDGERPFFHLLPDPGRPGGDPGSLRREALLFRRRFSGAIEDEVLTITTRCLTFDSLTRERERGAFDLLQIDTDGDEQMVLEQVDLDRFRPALIIYASGHLSPGASAAARRHVQAAGYETLEHGNDMWCLNQNALSSVEVPVLTPLWRWTTDTYDPKRPLRATAMLRAVARRARHAISRNGERPLEPFPLSDLERRYLAQGYDDSVPLPPGASTYLSPENPRLAELRREYAELDFPAARHHLWEASRVAEGVDLRHFRGDNLYLWRYPEHPRAMALSLFIYLRYLEARGGGELLRSLGEDGSFGCWTAEVTGYGKISRDLLDSVNELLFLDRQLSALSRPGLRVLDIGAGYGRLAHRMARAAPSLSDYCCVDAVPESTFLCEYYVSFRGCAPPARVIRLGEITGLARGSFDLAVNVHSFSECTLAAIEWWAGQLRRLAVPHLFVVPNEPDGLVSREVDGSYRDALPVLESAGYRAVACERVLADPAVRDLVRINDNFYLLELAG